MPSNKYGNTSSFRILNLNDEAVWGIGEKYVKARSEKIKDIFGRFDFIASDVYELKLDFDPDNKPVRHANIIKWPSGKTAQKSIAQQLAARSVFRTEVKDGKNRAQVYYDKENKRLCGSVVVNGKDVEFLAKEVNDLSSSLSNAIRAAAP